MSNPIITKCPTCHKGRNKNRKFNEFNECRDCWKLRNLKEKHRKENRAISLFNSIASENRYRLYTE